MKTSLEHKTIRPGSLADYSFYYSNRQAALEGKPTTHPPLPLKRLAKWALFLLLCVGLGSGAYTFNHNQAHPAAQPAAAVRRAKTNQNKPVSAQPAAVAATNHCAGNTIEQLVKVSINQRHLWACQGSRALYDAAVITGMEKHAATVTPLGTYTVYAKRTDLTLTGSDETGSWKDPVSYWMPFLDNQYGTYGFHDATWRDASEFGNIDANTSNNASHGCVELPLAASKWLYSWVKTGATVSIES